MFSKLRWRSRSGSPVASLLLILPLLIGGIYLLQPAPPAPCGSLKKFGAIEQGERCIINRNVTLEGNLKRLPNQLTVKGDLTISGTYIEELPNAMVVEGNLFLYKTSIAKLPPDLQVQGSFDQYSGFGSPGVKCSAIPKTAVIKGNRNCH
ncbi:hypothetical protein VF14_15845 [Nostoc linckia z18]|uniref:Uncharacterized protein n=2 Tax=Nostoc linckia TaxID=92942 RepID=A0A9Q5ZDC8_NOSLI|nr:hypothetical protein [Nostoc linckia]PHK40700.1 hypothetical protein VF12_09390 [Nostoc linckia z15]PHK48269.1 hypothetical protein VF13_00710 [Nostoc linckia z16]PHJ60936.1 hypothetical protein VF02_21085 [Nostoc linckia z1]PHJ64672.1 hypothetical protein VF05_22295 [Nostoc linckia z3]PHJ71527.1 hypothetical protein VF03_19930 [Nostoc linckia z2]